MSDGLLERWLVAVLETPGLTAVRELEQGRRLLLADALHGVELVRRFEGPIVDVGSGGGTPGIPLAVALSEREVTLLEAQRRKAEFLRRWERELPNLRVVWGRAEEQSRDVFGVAVAKALASPPVAAEWCLPLVRPGGAVVLWVGQSADRDRVAQVAARLAAEPVDAPDGFILLRKLGPTPRGFPRRSGMAKKRPLA